MPEEFEFIIIFTHIPKRVEIQGLKYEPVLNNISITHACFDVTLETSARAWDEKYIIAFSCGEKNR